MDPKSRIEALDWGPRQLGCGVVTIELTEAQVADAWDNALRWWIERRGFRVYYTVPISSGMQRYSMPADCDEVVEVYFTGVQMDSGALLEPYAFIDVDMLPVMSSSIIGGSGNLFYSGVHQVMSHAETARRVMSSEPAWIYYKEVNQLLVTPRRQTSGIAIVKYISNNLSCDDPVGSDDPPNQLKLLRTRDRGIILRWFLADLKEKLGRVRAKYTEWPSAGGGRSLDGDTLLGEAQGDKDQLREEIMGLSDCVPFITG